MPKQRKHPASSKVKHRTKSPKKAQPAHKKTKKATKRGRPHHSRDDSGDHEYR